MKALHEMTTGELLLALMATIIFGWAFAAAWEMFLGAYGG